MGTTEVTKQEAGDGTGASRRTVVKGFAWSVPVVAAAIAAPTSSASGCGTNAGSFGTTNPGVHDQWIPKCATRVRYIVRGGGGATYNTGFPLIGAAAEISGELALPATWNGGWLKLIVGAGGEAVEMGLAKGGIGFGRGGDGTDTSSITGGAGWSCAGGGGSAIKFGDALLVAAGGGGGSPIGVRKFDEGGTPVLIDFITYRDTHAPSGFPFGMNNANLPNGVGQGLTKAGETFPGAFVAPARGGVNGGAGASATWVAGTGNFVAVESFAGKDGGAVGSGFNGGGNGGAAAAAKPGYKLTGETSSLEITPAGGGGGGGHHGGGGGGFAFFRESITGFERAVAAASGGGAGSSFVATRVSGITVTGDVGMFTEAAEQRPGHLGRVWVAWS